MRQPPEYSKLWRGINVELWKAAIENVPPRAFVRAELWRRVDHARLLEKSAAIRMARKKTPPCAIFKACCWLVESGSFTPNGQKMPSESALSPENAAIPATWPKCYPGVDIQSQPSPASQSAPLDHYQLFVNAFFYAAQAAQNVGLDPHQIEFEFDFSNNRWRVEGTDKVPVKKISINFFYLAASPKIWNAIFEAIVNNHAPSRKIAERYVHSIEAQQLLATYADLSPLKSHDVYDLSAMFDALNAEYFNNKLPKPILAWTTRANYRTLGTYNFHWDIICISKIFNDKRVPIIAVEFVLYHEMLHIKHGLRHEAGRSYSHTPEFRLDEQKFKGWQEATAIHYKLRELVK